VANFNSFLDHASDLVVRYGGSFSAEHGDGQSKALYLRKMYGDELIEAFRQFKALWDPQWKMNPGKVVDPYHPDQNLRLGVNYDPWQPETRFRFPSDETSFARATLRCVGVGECRRTHDAFMCPSFQATREEQHTTRGRAHLLFEMFRRDFIKDGWDSREVLDALELCLSCKGCKGECPVNVDMASYKAEFLHHYYRRRLRPRPAYSMGLFGIWGRLGAGMPRLANLVSHAPLLSGVVKWIGGIDSARSMPTFAPESFTSAYRRSDKEPEQKGKDVVLYPDIFNDCFYPEILHAACEVLERFGYRVIIPDENPPAVRPPMDYGMLDYALKRLHEAIDLLSPYVRRGIPVVILEPSTAAVFRDELPELLPEHQDGKRLTAHTFLMSEFVLHEELQPPSLPGKVLLQAHCHEKSVLSLHARTAHELLAKMGLSVEEPEKGCCGMAGSFGFESGKYEVSMKIAGTNLLPAVREAGTETYIVADGFSCRTQILQGTGKRALHTAELLHLAFNRPLLPPPSK
jgi:Fe-S oxidoreductase